MGIGAIIGAGASIAGGLLQNKADKQARRAARAASALDYERQKEVLQNQIQWKVKDAVAAGLHPLAALGVNPADSGSSTQVFPASDWASQMGQNLGRAAESLIDGEDKTGIRIAQLGVERAQLENELVRSQIASQRFRNIQEASPSVSRRVLDTGAVDLGGPGKMPIPGVFGGGLMDVRFARGGDAAEAWAGDGVGDAFSAGFAADDIIKYNALERLLTDGNPASVAARDFGFAIHNAVAGDTRKGGYKSRYLQGRR